jgi:hypothetical protein
MKRIAFYASCLSFVAGAAQAAPTLYAFDTVTYLKLGRNYNQITGVERGTGLPLTAPFLDSTNNTFQYVVNRCVPLFVTAFEKPGRYYLLVTVDPAESNVQLVDCALEIKQ